MARGASLRNKEERGKVVEHIQIMSKVYRRARSPTPLVFVEHFPEYDSRTNAFGAKIHKILRNCPTEITDRI